MKKKNKITPDELDALHGALKELRATLGFDEDDETEDDEMKHEKICTELDALADELEQIERKAEMLTEKALAMDLNSDGVAKLFYAFAFMVKMNADAQRAQLQLAIDYIRKKNAEDER